MESNDSCSVVSDMICGYDFPDPIKTYWAVSTSDNSKHTVFIINISIS